jgi:2-isopropylmalate synthase
MSTASGNSEVIRIFDNALRDGRQAPRAAIFRMIRDPHMASLRLFQVHAVTDGTDAQPNVGVRLEENGRAVTARAGDTEPLLAAGNPYGNALSRLLVKREKQVPEALIVAR